MDICWPFLGIAIDPAEKLCSCPLQVITVHTYIYVTTIRQSKEEKAGITEKMELNR